MKHTFHLLFRLITIFILGATAMTASPESNAQYSEETVVRFQWGKGQYALGRKIMPDGAKFGPGAFDADDRGTLYILDTINKAVKIYSVDGRFIKGMPVELDGILGHMDVDTEGYIWINNSEGNELLKYDISGTLIERLIYIPGELLNHEPGITVHNGEITLSLSRLQIKEEAKNKPRFGEKIYIAELTRIQQYGRNGRYTGNNYRIKIQKGGSPRIIVSRNGDILYEQTLVNLDDSYGVSFIGEDSFGNSYFKVASLIRKSAKIYRFNTRFLLAGEIRTLPFFENRQYLGIKDLVVDSSGAIYYMCMEKNGVKIIRWKIE